MKQNKYVLSNLNMISRIALLENASESREAIDSLIAILRYMDFENERLSTMTDELNIIKKIFYLFQLKKRESFKGIMSEDEIPTTLYISKGIIIELVQIALNKKTTINQQQLEVKVVILIQKNLAEIIVQDNGNVDINIEEEELTKIYDDFVHSYEDQRITVEVKKGIGTKVKVIIPM